MIIFYVADISHLFSSSGKVDCTFKNQYLAIVTDLLFLPFEVFVKIRLLLQFAHPTELLPSLRPIIHIIRLKIMYTLLKY